MKEPILSREQILKIVRKTLKENNDRDKLSSDRFVALASAFEEALLEKLCGEPAEWQSRYVGDPRQRGIWDKCHHIEWAQKTYELPNHTDERGWEVRVLYALNRSKA